MSLKKYDPSNSYKRKTRKEVLKNAENLHNQEIRLLGQFKMLYSHLLKMCKKKRPKK